MRILANVTAVAINGRGILFDGPPGSGKSRLALELIDRGAILIGDDAVLLERRATRLWGHPPPNIEGKLEIRGVGIVDLPYTAAPLALVLSLPEPSERLPTVDETELEGVKLPRLAFPADASAAGLRAEWALRVHGLPAPDPLI